MQKYRLIPQLFDSQLTDALFKPFVNYYTIVLILVNDSYCKNKFRIWM